VRNNGFLSTNLHELTRIEEKDFYPQKGEVIGD